MSDKELFEKYAEICDYRQRRLMDVQETALFCALRDMLKKGAKLAELVNGPTQSTISHDDWYALRNERDALSAQLTITNDQLWRDQAKLAQAEALLREKDAANIALGLKWAEAERERARLARRYQGLGVDPIAGGFDSPGAGWAAASSLPGPSVRLSLRLRFSSALRFFASSRCRFSYE